MSPRGPTKNSDFHEVLPVSGVPLGPKRRYSILGIVYRLYTVSIPYTRGIRYGVGPTSCTYTNYSYYYDYKSYEDIK